MNNQPNIKNMILKRKTISNQKKKDVINAMNKLKDEHSVTGKPITKAEIIRLAKVSKSFIYSYPEELLKPINEIINESLKQAKKKNTISENSKDVLIKTLKRRITKLEEKNKQQRIEIEILLGRLSNLN